MYTHRFFIFNLLGNLLLLLVAHLAVAEWLGALAVRSSTQVTIMIGLSGGVWIAAAGFLAGPEWNWQRCATICGVSLVSTLGCELLNKDDRDSVLWFRYAH